MESRGEEDFVVQEIPVYLSQALAKNLFLLQYPLRPAHMPYDGSSIIGSRLKPIAGEIEVDVAMETKGPHYSRSKGEQYARMTEGDGSVPYFKSGVMDKQTLASNNYSQKTDPRYVAGVFKDGELHLTPLNAIVQMRPTLRHIELGESTSGHKSLGGAQSDGDTTATESEEEEAKPVTVKFARGGIKAKSETQPEEVWQTATYHSILSSEATEERHLLFGIDEDSTNTFTCTPPQYLNMVCPMETSQQNESPSGPSGVLSLTKLKTLPLERQVTELMKKAMLLQFDRVCTILGRARGEREAVLDDLQRCAVLVQGCWVVHSSLILSKELRNARDYVLWCFTKAPILTRKDLTSVLKITSPQLRDLLQPLASFKAGIGWHFRQSTDEEFLSKYPLIVDAQRAWWEKRHKEIVRILGIGVSPESSSSSANPSTQGTTIISGNQQIAMATQKAKEITTPSRQHQLPPSQIIKIEPTAGMDLKDIPENVQEALKEFCMKTIGKSVASFQQLKDELLHHQMSLPESNPLRQCGVSDAMIDGTLSQLDVVNVGEPHEQRVYAAKRIGDRTDEYRTVVVNMFKTARSLKRKQMTEEIVKQHGQDCDSKTLTSVLKDLCRSKGGGAWVITGLD